MTGDPTDLFLSCVAVKTLQSRYKEYIDFMTKHQNIVARATGTDDEQPDIFLDKLYELFEDQKTGTKSNKAQAQQRLDDRIKAKVIQSAAVAEGKTLKRTVDITLDSDDEETPTTTTPDTVKKFPAKKLMTQQMSMIEKFIDSRSEQSDNKSVQFDRFFEFQQSQAAAKTAQHEELLSIQRQQLEWEKEKETKKYDIMEQELKLKELELKYKYNKE